MIVLLHQNELIAAHEDLEVVQEYLSYQEDPDEYQLLSLKKKKTRELIRRAEFPDIYLVRYKNRYVPSQYVDVCMIRDREYDQELRWVRDVLFRDIELIEDKKLRKSYLRVIANLDARIEDAGTPTHKDLVEMQRIEDERQMAKIRWGL